MILIRGDKVKSIKNLEPVKLFDNIKKYSDPKLANEIVSKNPLSDNPSDKECAKWVYNICKALDNKLDKKTIANIRQGCFCNEEDKLDKSKKWLKEIYDSSLSITDFVNRVNEYSTQWILDENHLFTKYFDCPCHMLKEVNKLETSTWCECTAGYNREIFSYVFSCNREEIEVKVIDSIKMGGEECVLKITFPKYLNRS